MWVEHTPLEDAEFAGDPRLGVLERMVDALQRLRAREQALLDEVRRGDDGEEEWW